MKFIYLPLALLTLGFFTATAQAYDPVTDFLISSNSGVNGVWSYGRTSTIGGSFISLPIGQTYNSGNIEAWRGDTSGFGNGGYPYLLKNTTGSTQVTSISSGSTYTHLADELVFQVGDTGFNNAIPVLRFVVPATGTYQLQGAFTGRETTLTTTDTHILLNNGGIFAGNINVSGGGNVASFNITQSFQAGDILDFAVGDGGNGSLSSESTGLKLNITPVTAPVSAPEPASLALLSLAAPLALVRRKKGQQ